MFERNNPSRDSGGRSGKRCRFLAAMVFAAATLCTTIGAPASAQTAPAPKNGLYLYVCMPGNIQGDLTKGGSGLLVFNVDQGYKFVERIPLPEGPGGGEPASCKGIDASIQTGYIYPMITDRLLAVDLATSKLAWQQTYDGGCCDRGAVSPFGETLWMAGNRVATWYVVSAYNGTLIDPIKEFPQRAHNTQMSPRGDQVLLSPANDILYLYDTRTHKKIREIGPFFARNRPFVVNGDWTRVYSNNNGYLGFTAADIETGQILYRLDAPGTPPCQTSSGAHGTCVHGLALTHDETAMWFPGASDNSIWVYHMNDADKPHLQAKIQDYAPSGWITCGIDGTRMYPASGTVFDTHSLKPIARLVDENGQFVYSEKLMEVRFASGKPVQVGDQWCNGLKGSGRFATSGQAIGRTAPGYKGYEPPGPKAKD